MASPKIADCLDLKIKEKDYFYNLVLLESAKSFELKEVVEKLINSLGLKNITDSS